MTSLTLKRLRAIEEALCARLAGPLDDTEIDAKTYESAHDWAFEQIEKRKGQKNGKSDTATAERA